MSTFDTIQPPIKESVDSFVKSLKKLSGDNLKSVLMYGGYAKGDYTEGKSNMNMLLVFDQVDLLVLDKLSILFQQAMADFRLSPFILTASEVHPSSDVFAVKLFDIKRHHVLLYGEDVLAGLEFEKAHLKFISEQELRNQLARMKYFYIQNFNLPEQLLNKVQKGYTTLIINANTFLYLKTGTYLKTRKEIAGQLLKEAEFDPKALAELQAVRENTSETSPELIKEAYDKLMLQYKALIHAFKGLKQNG